MADEFITVAPLDTGAERVQHRQAIIPNYRKATYVADDQDAHKLLMDARGKGRFSFVIDNPSNKDVVATLYGCHTEDDDVGDAGVMEIGGSGAGSITALAGDDNYDTCNDPFPFYILSCTSAATPDGETVTIWVNFSAF